MTASKSKTEQPTDAEIAKLLNLPAKSADYFRALASDAGNWSGTPWLDGNVAAGRSASAMSQTLVKRGLIEIQHGEGGDGQEAAYAVFTVDGVRAASLIGIDELAHYYPEHAAAIAAADVVPAPAHEISNDAAANRKAASKASAAARKSSAKPADEKASKSKASKSSSKPAEKPSEPTRDLLSEHIVAVFKGKKRGTFLSASEIANAITDVFPSEDERPSSQTISGRCRDNRMPSGIEGKSGPRGAAKL